MKDKWQGCESDGEFRVASELTRSLAPHLASSPLTLRLICWMSLRESVSHDTTFTQE